MTDPAPGSTTRENPAADDPHLWLEDVTGDDALEWVHARNAETTATYTERPRFLALRDEIREALDADDRIPYVRRRGEYLYNFWRDAQHPRGLWRRTTLAEYRTATPDWDVLIDVDALAEAEDENWVWQGAAVLRPELDRCLVELSRGGADATVVREFDLRRREFVADGFGLPEAKSSVSWIDADHIYVGTDTGEGSLTDSGYPRVVQRWRRGTPLAEAETVFEGKPDDVSVRAFHDPTEGWERDFVRRNIEFYRSELYLLSGGRLTRVDVPDDAVASVHREWLLVRTRTPWGEHPAGALLAARFDEFMAGDRTMTVLFEPDAHTSLDYYAWTRHHLILGTLHDVKTRLRVLTPDGDTWRDEPLAGLPDVGTVDLVDTEPDADDEFLLEVTGFTQPSSLVRGIVDAAGGGEREPLKQAPARFDADGLTTEQHFAVSADGTRIPYFVVRRAGAEPGPTLLGGYGGFEVSQTPYYSAVIGRAWLARGGTYVLANIRGGGEYGPDWHNQAIKEHRHRVYEDFAAVARDLSERDITTPARLGIQGGSNGGLLMGVMLTRYPELFGAIVCQVPLLDMRRYHLLLAGASWMAEYGDPDDPEQWSYIGAYSPYHHVRSGQPYPPLLMLTSTRDDRVHPGHARKMVARLLAEGYSPDDVRYYENVEGGHGGAADNAQLAFKSALAYEFLWERLGG
ncbi:prolyl oligopeptidase [Saccharomonospora sp. CUA-673]|uniref:prolyl oligopeptidase family serine peptidase n=1 Tax=Saccharomonospora sp. CUA-673 TaxID=1904969 RepID=UPI0009690270|nr:prolyl oligopeptidase family serine peptidase [Saccharomonospora sp. CUA-673]OLT48587.1 prolyl oligopeptidase [Saccharomonospora sp. CUA-673]